MTSRRLWTLLVFLGTALAQPEARWDSEASRARDAFNQGMVHYQRRAYEAAAEKFKASLGERGRDNLVRYYLGMALYQGGYTAAALEQWETIVRLGGQDAVLAQKMGAVYARLGRKETLPVMEDYVPLKLLPEANKSNQAWQLYPTGLFVDRGDRIWFADHKRSAFGVISPNGDKVDFLKDGWQSRLPGLQGLNKPVEILFRDEGSFWLSDFGGDRVHIIDRSGKILTTFGSKGTGTNGEMLGPEGLAPGPSGQVFVADTGNCRIQLFNARGTFISSFGNRGREKGEFLLPAGLASDLKRQRLYVADRGNNRIVICDFEGNHLGSFGETFLIKPRKVMVADAKGETLAVADAHNVYLFRPKDDLYRSLFYSVGDTLPRDVQPLSMAFDRSGLLYVGDARRGGIEVFAPTARLYVNLNLATETINLQAFPRVIATVRVLTREGLPITGLTRANFEIRENGVPRTVNLSPRPESWNDLRLTLLVDKSRPAEERQLVLKAMLEDLYATLKPGDQTRPLALAGGDETGRGTFKELQPMNNQVLRNIEDILKAPWQDRVFPGTPLRRCLLEQVNIKNQRGVLVFLFGEPNKALFGPESIDTLADYASHNGIPVTVIYAGTSRENKKLKGPAPSDPLLPWKEICRRSGGLFLVYENKATLESAVNHHRNLHDGAYDLSYESFPNTLKTGLFRPVEVRVTYKGMTGIDNRGGYPIP